MLFSKLETVFLFVFKKHEQIELTAARVLSILDAERRREMATHFSVPDPADAANICPSVQCAVFVSGREMIPGLSGLEPSPPCVHCKAAAQGSVQ